MQVSFDFVAIIRCWSTMIKFRLFRYVIDLKCFHVLLEL